MADLVQNSAMALTIETVPGTFNTPNTTTDLLQCANLTVTVNGITQAITEYLGSIHAPGPVVLGSTLDISGKIYLRGPGGTTPPAAGAYVPGRILRMASHSETIISAAIPAAPEALGAGGTTTSATLGATAAATADLYKGLMVFLAQLGVGSLGATMIRSYSAAKAAGLAITGGSAFTGTNYQIPKQLAYQISPASVVPTGSISVWLGSRRFDGVGMAITSFKYNFPTASRTLTELPSIEFTMSGDLYADADQAAPVITPGLAIPPFHGGQFWVANLQLGGSAAVVDFKAQAAYPPDANKTTGNGPAQLAKTERSVSLTLNQVLKATADFKAIADSQAQIPTFLQYGSATGNMFGFIVTDARANYRSPTASGDFYSTSGDLYSDGANREISLVIPFF